MNKTYSPSDRPLKSNCATADSWNLIKSSLVRCGTSISSASERESDSHES